MNELRIDYDEDIFAPFLNYFEREWKRINEIGIISYQDLNDQRERSNSIMENFHLHYQKRLNKFTYNEIPTI